MPVLEFIALPNVQERPQQLQPKPSMEQPSEAAATKPSPSTSRPLSYLVKSDLESPAEFIKWWNNSVVAPKLEQERLAQEQGKVNKFDSGMLSSLLALVNCIRNNSILPVVYPSEDNSTLFSLEKKEKDQTRKEDEKVDIFRILFFNPNPLSN